MEIKHGVDGWVLVEMDWDPRTGLSVFEYERVVDGVVETAYAQRCQPTIMEHEGWWERDRTERVLGFTDCDWSRIERGLYNEPVEIDWHE